MAFALAAVAIGFVVALLQPGDAVAAARARSRVLAALPTAAAPSAEPVTRSRLLGPSVLAHRDLRPALPPLITLPPDVADALPSDSPDARREVAMATSETSRPTVYRLPDGRLFVIQQTTSDRGRPALVNWFEEGVVRGWTAQMYSAPVGPFRALVWWTEGPVTYYMYSGSVTVRELVRLTDQLR